MSKLGEKISLAVERVFVGLGLGMRAKLICLFVVIKVVPLIIIALLAWHQASDLGEGLKLRAEKLAVMAKEALLKAGNIAVNDSVKALNERATEDIERMSTDTARMVANFLYERDDDIKFAATLPRTVEAYKNFIENKNDLLVKQGRWVLSEDKKKWVEIKDYNPEARTSSIKENETSFNYRPPESFEYESRPLYLEMTFVDLNGQELVKTVTSPQMDNHLKNVADKANTYVKAEGYFAELKKLKPGEIYVSDVIGEYVGSKIIGTYNPENAAKIGDNEFRPDLSAYAGKENPLGKRFKGIVRWATPVVENGAISGYVTLALDHDHIMEFTSHLMPTKQRYTEIPDASEGNYAFIWDHKGRSIVHPRHFSIAGYDAKTGDPQVPWLEDKIYEEWKASGKKYGDFIKDVPTFVEQSNSKKGSKELTKEGLVGLDCRYLNFAPQCTGWFDLTEDGGSGSFLILWSGLWKLNTAAAIPYYTGQYSTSKRGFGFVAIGAGVDDFHRSAKDTEKNINEVINENEKELNYGVRETMAAIASNLFQTAVSLSISTGIMIIIVIMVAIWMASAFTRSITGLISGITRFRHGERQFRFNAQVKDEMGMLADSFDDMADSIVQSVKDPLAIIDLDQKILYMNDSCLKTVGKTLNEVIGQPYGELSIYPDDDKYSPIKALLHKREAEIFYHQKSNRYFKGKATYLKDKNDKDIGYVIASNDVTEIAMAVNEARAANASKSDFLARMSHEIRTPMNAIIGIVSIIKQKISRFTPKQTELLGQIGQVEKSSKHLLGLLNDVLDISKIESGKVELSEEKFELATLLSDIASIIEPRCVEKNLKYTIILKNFKDDNAYLFSDPLRLRQVLINLLGNSVKFTPKDGSIELRVEKLEDKAGKMLVRFEVVDTGIGIAPEDIKRLFDPFDQVNNNITKQFGGTGLGLTISKNIVGLMGSEIKVESEVDKGSKFYFEVWLRENFEMTRAPKAMDESELNLKGKRALLVDDNAVNRMIVKEFLTPTNIEIEEAENGKQAVDKFEAAAEGYYDVILMDIQMPEMDGYEAAKAIRASVKKGAKDITIIALTANAFKEDIDKATNSGMNGHIAKPIDADKLIKTISNFLLFNNWR